MTTYVPVVKNDANGLIFYAGLIDQSNTKLLKSTPTLAAGDFKISIDGGAFANLTNLPTVTPAAGRSVKFVLTQAEVNGDNLVIACVDAAGAEWCDLFINIQTSARHIDDLAFPTVSGRSLDVSTTGEAGLDWANIGSPTTTVNFSSTTVGTVTTITAGGLDAADRQLLRKQTATASSASTLTLDSGASATDSYYNDAILIILSGTGIAQSRLITGYVGSTKVATVSPNWTTTPGATVDFAVVANARADLSHITGTAVATGTAQLGVNLVNIAGAAVSTSTAQLGVNAVNWAGGAIPAPSITGTPKVDLVDIGGVAISATTAQLGVNVVNWNNTVVATPNTAGVPLMDLVRINGGLTSGNNATLSLKQLNVTNSTGDAVVFSSSGSNGIGLNISGNGTGAGAQITGGATGPAAKLIGGGTSGAGLSVITTAGDGLLISPTAGHGVNIAANGTSKHGLFVTGGTAGTSDGISAVAGTGGVDVRGNITGNLSGSIGSLGATAKTDVRTAVLTTQMTEAYAADGVAPTLAQAVFLMQQLLSDFSITSTTMTVRKLDGSTTAATLTLNSATTPTSITRTT